MNIKAIIFTRDKLKLFKRKNIISNFQHELKKNVIIILIEIYIFNFANLNFQYLCKNVYLFDFAFSHEVVIQIVDRYRRIEQIKKMIVIHYNCIETINDAQIWRNVQKAFSFVLIQFNMRVFDDQENIKITLNDLNNKWALNVNEKLMKATNLTTRDFSKLSLKKLIFAIMNKMSEAIFRAWDNMLKCLLSCITY